jgi:phenylacetate-CoA ligase
MHSSKFKLHKLNLKRYSDFLFYFKSLDKNYRDAKRRLSWSPEKMQEFVLQNARDIVDYAYNNTEFYHEEFEKAGYSPNSIRKLSDLEFLPILTKRKLREAVKNKTIFPKNVDLGDLSGSATTGSTGEPLTVYYDETANRMGSLNFVRSRALMGIKPFERCLQIWRKKETGIIQKTMSFFKLYKYISVVDIFDVNGSAINKDVLKSIAEEIKKFRPDTLEGYVSALYVLARFVKSNNIDLRPKRVICRAEYLPHSIWDELKEIFRCPVHNLYGGTEAGLVALSTDDVSKKMYFIDDFYWAEMVGEDGKAVSPGNVGRILVTNYYLRAMPMIRYEIGDIAEPTTEFHGPFRTAKEIHGRINDIFVLPNGKLFFSHNWHIYFRDFPGLERFKVIQEELNKISINLLPNDKEVLLKNLDRLKKILRDSLGDDVILDINIVEALPFGPGEKFRAVESKINWRQYL